VTTRTTALLAAIVAAIERQREAIDAADLHSVVVIVRYSKRGEYPTRAEVSIRGQHILASTNNNT
jgi:hypothetical protein